MHLEKCRWRDVAILGFIGELDDYDLDAVAARIDVLVESGEDRLVLDLARLTFVTSSGLSYLLRLKHHIEERGGRLVLASPSTFLARTLRTLGLDEVFAVARTREEAVARAGGEGGASAVRLADLPVESGRELLGGNATLFLLADAPAAAVPPGHVAYAIARTVERTEESALLRWRLPEPGTEAAGCGITAETFDRQVRPGTRLLVRWRPPLAVRSAFTRAEAKVTSAERRRREDGSEEAELRIVLA